MFFYSYILFGLAGYLNALTILQFKTMTGVQTGNISNIFINLFANEYNLSMKLLLYVLSFIVGSIIVGYFTHHKIKFQHRMLQFAGIHLITAFFLFLSFYLNWSDYFIVSLISLRMGMQNAFPVINPRNRIRTTSLTGLITEIGITIGSKVIYKNENEVFNVFLNIMYLIVFIIGIVFASYLYQNISIFISILFISIIEVLTAIYCLYTGTLKK